MAKQKKGHYFTGKLGGLIGYVVNGEPLIREDGSKEGKAFRKDPRRRWTMYNAGLFAEASKLVRLIYRALPKDQRRHGVYGKLTGKAMRMLKEGKPVEEVKKALSQLYLEEREPLIAVNKEGVLQHDLNERTVELNGPSAVSNKISKSGRQTGGKSGKGEMESKEDHVMITISMPVFYTTICR